MSKKLTEEDKYTTSYCTLSLMGNRFKTSAFKDLFCQSLKRKGFQTGETQAGDCLTTLAHIGAVKHISMGIYQKTEEISFFTGSAIDPRNYRLFTEMYFCVAKAGAQKYKKQIEDYLTTFKREDYSKAARIYKTIRDEYNKNRRMKRKQTKTGERNERQHRNIDAARQPKYEVHLRGTICQTAGNI